MVENKNPRYINIETDEIVELLSDVSVASVIDSKGIIIFMSLEEFSKGYEEVPALTADQERYAADPHELIKDENTNAQDWAIAWQGTCKRNNIDTGGIDEGYMISWLANAIMNAIDVTHRQYEKVEDDKR